MKLHEYQARELLANHGIPVPQWILVETPDEAAKSYEQLESDHGAQMCVVKAQVHAGGRGKGDAIYWGGMPAAATSSTGSTFLSP